MVATQCIQSNNVMQCERMCLYSVHWTGEINQTSQGGSSHSLPLISPSMYSPCSTLFKFISITLKFNPSHSHGRTSAHCIIQNKPSQVSIHSNLHSFEDLQHRRIWGWISIKKKQITIVVRGGVGAHKSQTGRGRGGVEDSPNECESI